MKKSETSNVILHLLSDADKAGLTGFELKRLANMPEEAFEKASKNLWDKGRLTGLRVDKCCQRGCGFMCVSYMDAERVWRLI